MFSLAFQFLFHQNLTRIKLRTSNLPKRVLRSRQKRRCYGRSPAQGDVGRMGEMWEGWGKRGKDGGALERMGDTWEGQGRHGEAGRV